VPHPVHDVPVCRQRITPEEWQEQAGWSLGDRIEWSGRACGIACLRMLLLAYDKPAPSITELLKAAVKADALSERGWIHAGPAALATERGIPAQAEPVAVEDLPTLLESAPLIISVTEQFPQDGRRGGHLVIARGLAAGDEGPDLLIRDPSSWGRQHDRVPLARAAASYTGRAITFAPLPAR
jgi:hypothetical protein